MIILRDFRQQANKMSTTMYTSYAKDIFVALFERTQVDNIRINATDNMELAIKLVKQAKEAFE